MNVAEWVVSKLVHLGAEYIFTLQGGYSMYLNDAIGHSSLKPIYMLNESGAAFAAAGYAQKTGKMGVCVVTSGLAQTNALSGVASAYSDYLPVMVISGDIKHDLIVDREIMHLRQGGQQDVPIDKIAHSVTMSVCVARSAEHVCTVFAAMWHRAWIERGPVWLDVPLDVQQEEVPNE
jgi:acetolactate synthase I/II/III large subunit